MKKVLLASTAIAGAAIFAAPAANAANAMSGDNYSVTLSGIYQFMVIGRDEDISTGHGRGYQFSAGEGEIHVDAKAKADNGIKYGVHVELNSLPSDGTAADEIYAQISGDNWGTLRLGDDDAASNTMKIGSFLTNVSADGTLGGVTSLGPMFHGQFPGILARADWEVGFSGGDSTKIIYFSPRFAGFQVGGSLMPQSNAQGNSAGSTDNGTSYQNVWDLAANYVGTFGDVGVKVGGAYTDGTNQGTVAGVPGTDQGNIQVWTVGGLVTFGGFSLGADYRDNGEFGVTDAQRTAGADAGRWWSVGASYKMGPWGIDAHYANGKQDNTTAAARSDTTVKRYAVGANYNVAPGWSIQADIERIKQDGPSSVTGATNTDQSSTAYALTNKFVF